MNILYVGLFSYPDSNANSIRVDGVCQLLTKIGHNVSIIPGLSSSNSENFIYKGVNVIPVNEYKDGFLGGFNGVRGLFIGGNTLQILEKMKDKPDVIILYGTALGYLIRLLDFTKKYNIKLILDVVEWYDPRHLPGGVLGPYALINELSMRFFVKRADGLIVISNYLKNYYKTNNTFLLPPVFSQNANINYLKHEMNVLNLCYVGTPGKKENFEALCNALELAYKNNIKFYMHFVGFQKDFFANKHLTFIHDISVCKFYGRVVNSAAKLIVADCHYSIFFRPNLRFANAGFPSKIAESFSVGTSIISNDFSDLKNYICNDNNGYIIDGDITPKKIYELIKNLSMNISNYNIIQNNVLDSYRHYFSLNSYPNFEYYINEFKSNERK